MSASARRTLDSDNITLRTVFARGLSNTVIPSSFVLTADGQGGTFWSTPYLKVNNETISSLQGNAAQFSSLQVLNICKISSINANSGFFSTLGSLSGSPTFSTIQASSMNVVNGTISSLAVNVGLFSTLLTSTLTTSTLFANTTSFSTLTSYSGNFSTIFTSTLRTSTLTVNSAAYVSSLVIKTQSNTITYPMPCGQIGILNTASVTINNPLITSLSIILVTPASSAYSGNYYVSAYSGYFTINLSTIPVISQYFNYAVVSY